MSSSTQSQTQTTMTDPVKTIEPETSDCKQTSEVATDQHTPQMISDVTIPPNFGAILSQQGPTVKAVLLKQDGSAVEVDFDSTPNQMHAYKILQSPPTIVGQYHTLDVIVISGRVSDTTEFNKNELRWPFNDHQIRGNVLLYRIDSDCKNCDFTLDEYNTFLSRKSEDAALKAEWEKDCTNDPSLSKTINFREAFEDAMTHAMSNAVSNIKDLSTIDETNDTTTGDVDNDDADDSEEILFCTNDDEEDDSGDGMVSIDKLTEILRSKMKQEYAVRNGKEPSEDELNLLTEKALNELLEWNKQFDEIADDSTDGEDDDNNDQDAKNVDESGVSQDNDTQERKQQTDTTDMNDDEDTDMSGFDQAFEAATSSLDPKQRAKVLEMAKAMYEAEVGVQVPTDELISGFEALNVQIDDDIVVTDTATDENTLVNDESDDELPMSEEELRKELSEAFEHIRKLAKTHQPRIVRSICATFKEVNGIEPNVDEVSNIFQNIKNAFAQEAKDELYDNDDNLSNGDPNDNLTEFEDVAVSNKLTAAQEELALSIGIKTLYNQETGTTSDELRNYAREVVRQDLKKSAKKQFMELAGREPTKEEFVEILVQLATTTFVDANFDQVSDGDSDYNPEADIHNLVNDEKDDEVTNDELQNEFDYTSQMHHDDATTVLKGPILTTPVKNVGKTASRVDFYTKSQNTQDKLLNRSIKKFEKVHHRKPTDAEIEKMGKFVSIEGTLLSKQFGDADEDESENNENKSDVANTNNNNNNNSDKIPFMFGNTLNSGAFGSKGANGNDDPFAGVVDDDGDDDSDSDYVPPTNDSEDCSDDDIEDYINQSAEDRPLL